MKVMPVAKPALAVEIPGRDWAVGFVDTGHRALLRMRATVTQPRQRPSGRYKVSGRSISGVKP